jgi:hypothetical protein
MEQGSENSEFVQKALLGKYCCQICGEQRGCGPMTAGFVISEAPHKVLEATFSVCIRCKPKLRSLSLDQLFQLMKEKNVKFLKCEEKG